MSETLNLQQVKLELGKYSSDGKQDRWDVRVGD